jgi:hypothetical protein
MECFDKSSNATEEKIDGCLWRVYGLMSCVVRPTLMMIVERSLSYQLMVCAVNYINLQPFRTNYNYFVSLLKCYNLSMRSVT